MSDGSSGTRSSSPLRTRFCELVGVEHPIIQTGMGWVSGANLTAATSAAGAFGILAAVTMTFEQMRDAVAHVKERTDRPFGVNFRPDQPDLDERIRFVADRGVRLVSFAGAPSADTVKRLHETGILVMPTVGARRHAEKMLGIGVDAVIAQGGEGGGHTGTVPTSLLLPQVVDAVGEQIPVLGAGGFHDGRGLVAALAYGADGIAMGTRFLLTQESRVPDDVKSSYTEATVFAAALSYYTIFSLAPLLLITISVAGLVFGEEAARGQIVGQIQQMVGKTGAEAIQGMLESANHKSTGIFATVVGVVLLLLGASGVFGQLQDALNTIWDAPKRKAGGIWSAVRDRFLSFSMVFGVGFLLLVSLVVSAGLSAAGSALGGFMAASPFWAQALNFVLSFAVITVGFALLYKFLPDIKIEWHDVWIGAVATSILFTIGKLLIGLYLGHSSTASSFGAAGSLVVLLVWIYYSAQIFLFGAEFTQVYARAHGSHATATVKDKPVESAASASPSQKTAPKTPVAVPEPLPPTTRPAHASEGVPGRVASGERYMHEPASASSRSYAHSVSEREPASAATGVAGTEKHGWNEVAERLASVSKTVFRYYKDAKKFREEERAKEAMDLDRRDSTHN